MSEGGERGSRALGDVVGCRGGDGDRRSGVRAAGWSPGVGVGAMVTLEGAMAHS